MPKYTIRGDINMKKLQLGIIGCGAMTEFHARGFEDLKDLIEVAAVVDIDFEKAKESAQVLGDVIAETNYEKILPYVDAVLIVLPHDLHHSVTIKCLQEGKHVLVEKPMAITEKECLEMIEEARNRNLVLMTAYPTRFNPLIESSRVSSHQYKVSISSLPN